MSMCSNPGRWLDAGCCPCCQICPEQARRLSQNLCQTCNCCLLCHLLLLCRAAAARAAGDHAAAHQLASTAQTLKEQADAAHADAAFKIEIATNANSCLVSIYAHHLLWLPESPAALTVSSVAGRWRGAPCEGHTNVMKIKSRNETLALVCLHIILSAVLMCKRIINFQLSSAHI